MPSTGFECLFHFSKAVLSPLALPTRNAAKQESIPKLQVILDVFLPRVQLVLLPSLPGGEDRLS